MLMLNSIQIILIIINFVLFISNILNTNTGVSYDAAIIIIVNIYFVSECRQPT